MRPFKTSIPAEVPSTPASSGATKPAGKTSQCDSAITDALVLKAKPEPVRDAVEVSGGARAAIDTQLMRDQIKGTTSSGKKRPAATWGIKESSKK